MIFALWKSAVSTSRLISLSMDLYAAVDFCGLGFFPTSEGKGHNSSFCPVQKRVEPSDSWCLSAQKSVWRKLLCLAVPQFQGCQCFLIQPTNTFSTVISLLNAFPVCDCLHISEVLLRASPNRRFRFKLEAVHLIETLVLFLWHIMIYCQICKINFCFGKTLHSIFQLGNILTLQNPLF